MKTLLNLITHELNQADDAVGYLIVINDMWWERNCQEGMHILSVPKSMAQKVINHARSLYIHLDLDQIKEHEEWFNLMKVLYEQYKVEVEIDTGWKPLNL